jgi:Asp-tRNA(Asn)/Glu-tRNA(Gln) amidotransferase A subunit family amidase
LALQAEEQRRVTPEMIRQAEWISGIELSEEDREKTSQALERTLRDLDAMRKVDFKFQVPPAICFSTLPQRPSAERILRNQAVPRESRSPRRPDADDTLAFLPVTELSALIRSRQITSLELTELYLRRLEKYDKVLRCVVTRTDELARNQATRADREIAGGIYRGPLHGIPWGAKDLIAYPGYPTTWGAPVFKERVFNYKATVAERLDEAGAVLVAKLSLGALAQGDKWFGDFTRNPWNPAEGSSGSSAGSASAVAAGLVAFAIGSETLGSIVSPCQRCSVTGLRPTYGRVSRQGCMELSWTMDKIGPIARSVEDCALVLDAIHGFDGQDMTAVDQPFEWPPRGELSPLRVGYFEGERPEDERPELDWE